MIPYDFDYTQPASVAEAVSRFAQYGAQGNAPVYIGGGTELITLSRIGRFSTDAVVDIKAIPECRVLETNSRGLVIGAAVTLAELSAANVFPLLSAAADGIADQTARNKITLGGNVCARILYREAVLPLLLTDSSAVIAGPHGSRTVAMEDAFRRQMQLERGEFVVQFVTAVHDTMLPYSVVKRRKFGGVGYPVATVAAVKKEGRIRVAFSGLCPFPFRSVEIEHIVNDASLSYADAFRRIARSLPAPLLHNADASAEYREFVLFHTLYDVLSALRMQGG
jgi:xanthine dehydrogenase molybdenum-binding subunit